jgi:hypothetical protein
MVDGESIVGTPVRVNNGMVTILVAGPYKLHRTMRISDIKPVAPIRKKN